MQSNKNVNLPLLPAKTAHLPHYRSNEILDRELAAEALIEDLRQPFLTENKKHELTAEALGELRALCKMQEVDNEMPPSEQAATTHLATIEAIIPSATTPLATISATIDTTTPATKRSATEAKTKTEAKTTIGIEANTEAKFLAKREVQNPNPSGLLFQRILCFLAFMAGIIKVITAEYALAAAAATTLDFDKGIAGGVDPIIKLVLTHNGKAIFLSSAIGMLLGGVGGGDGWARIKMGGLGAIGAAALIHVMKGTLGIA